MATNNATWGEERIANELLLKIRIKISPRTVRRYMPKNPKRPTHPSQRWMTFVRNHASAIIAADFFVACDRNISACLCAGDYGDWDTTYSAFERDAASYRGMDIATIPRVRGWRRRLQIHHS